MPLNLSRKVDPAPSSGSPVAADEPSRVAHNEAVRGRDVGDGRRQQEIGQRTDDSDLFLFVKAQPALQRLDAQVVALLVRPQAERADRQRERPAGQAVLVEQVQGVLGQALAFLRTGYSAHDQLVW